MRSIIVLTLCLIVVGCGGGSDNTGAAQPHVSVESCPVVTQTGKYKIAIIDVPRDLDSVTSQGLPVNGLENVALHIDRARCLGFDTVEFQTFVPIDPATGLLQLYDTNATGGDRYKGLPRDYWRFVTYAKQTGMRVVIKMVPSDYRNDELLHVSAYPNLPVTNALESMKAWYLTNMQQAQILGVDVFYVGYWQIGFDNANWARQWQGMIKEFRSVFYGKLAYATCQTCQDNVVWDLVDIVGVSFEPAFRSSCNATVNDIMLSYQAATNGVRQLKLRHNKTIWLDQMNFDAAGCSLTNWSYNLLTSNNLSTSIVPDYNWQSRMVSAMLLSVGCHIADQVHGLTIGTFLPWTQASWIQHPTKPEHEVWHMFDRLGYSLYNNQMIQQTLNFYLTQHWGWSAASAVTCRV